MAHVSICAGLRAILLGIDLIVAHMCVCMCMCVHLYAHNQFSAYGHLCLKVCIVSGVRCRQQD